MNSARVNVPPLALALRFAKEAMFYVRYGIAEKARQDATIAAHFANRHLAEKEAATKERA